MTYQIHERDAELRGEERGMAKGRAEGMIKGRAEGMVKGRAEGENRLSQLINILIGNKEYDKVTLVTTDVSSREKYYKQYGIT